jgi:ABC-type uncharacterized transport system substrate-binding protein
MGPTADPVGTGFVASLARPGGNITGASLMAPELAGKRLELLRELLAARNRLPTVSDGDQFAEVGGLIYYGPDRFALYRVVATYVDKILKGAKPAELPVEQPQIFQLVINLQTAKRLGLTIPQSILFRADKVITEE